MTRTREKGLKAADVCNSLVELCRHEEELHVETWVMFSPSELGQHYRN